MFTFHVPIPATAETQAITERIPALPHRRNGLRRYRFVALVVLCLLGLYTLVGIKGTSFPAGPTLSGQRSSSQSTTIHSSRPVVAPVVAPAPATSLGTGTGTGTAGRVTIPDTTNSTCINPLDPSCWTQQIAQWLAQTLLQTLQPLIDAINHSSLNILTQTPPNNTYGNATVMTLSNGMLQVVDAALAVLIMVGGYNVMVGRQIGLRSSELAEFLPHLILAVLAAHFSLFFIQLFIDLENALCLSVIHLAGLSMLTNTIVAIFQGNLLGAGFLVFALALILAGIELLLAVQMIVRLALLNVLIILAPLALLCFALPQTQRWAHLWTSLFSATVFVQFFQVATLALGGVLVTALGQSNVLNLDSTLVTLFVSIGVLFLVLRLPGMLNTWALRPMTDASTAVARTAQGAAEYAATTAPRLLALL